MNTGSLSSLLTIKNLKTIKVKFPDTSKTYTYKTVDSSIIQDDFVIVSFNDAMIKIARVIEVDDVPDLTKDVNYKWIVQKVDFNEYNALNESEKQTFTKLRNLQNKALVKNAAKLLADELNINVKTLKKTISDTNDS